MGRVASYNSLAVHPGYLLQQKLKHSCFPATPAAFLLSCSASCTAQLMLFFFCSRSYFCNGSDLRRCAGKTCFSWVIPDRCKQTITASIQGEVSRRFACSNWKALCSKSLSYCEKICVSLRGKIWKASNSESSP
jgi:hypothetical protein